MTDKERRQVQLLRRLGLPVAKELRPDAPPTVREEVPRELQPRAEAEARFRRGQRLPDEDDQWFPGRTLGTYVAAAPPLGGSSADMSRATTRRQEPAPEEPVVEEREAVLPEEPAEELTGIEKRIARKIARGGRRTATDVDAAEGDATLVRLQAKRVADRLGITEAEANDLIAQRKQIARAKAWQIPYQVLRGFGAVLSLWRGTPLPPPPAAVVASKRQRLMPLAQAHQQQYESSVRQREKQDTALFRERKTLDTELTRALSGALSRADATQRAQLTDVQKTFSAQQKALDAEVKAALPKRSETDSRALMRAARGLVAFRQTEEVTLEEGEAPADLEQRAEEQRAADARRYTELRDELFAQLNEVAALTSSGEYPPGTFANEWANTVAVLVQGGGMPPAVNAAGEPIPLDPFNADHVPPQYGIFVGSADADRDAFEASAVAFKARRDELLEEHLAQQVGAGILSQEAADAYTRIESMRRTADVQDPEEFRAAITEFADAAQLSPTDRAQLLATTERTIQASTGQAEPAPVPTQQGAAPAGAPGQQIPADKQAELQAIPNEYLRLMTIISDPDLQNFQTVRQAKIAYTQSPAFKKAAQNLGYPEGREDEALQEMLRMVRQTDRTFSMNRRRKIALGRQIDAVGGDPTRHPAEVPDSKLPSPSDAAIAASPVGSEDDEPEPDLADTDTDTDPVDTDTDTETELPPGERGGARNMAAIGADWGTPGHPIVLSDTMRDKDGRPVAFSAPAMDTWTQMIAAMEADGVAYDPRVITSTTRSSAYNAKIGGAATSFHLDVRGTKSDPSAQFVGGRAVDLDEKSPMGKWILANGAKYGWRLRTYGGHHGGHIVWDAEGERVPWTWESREPAEDWLTREEALYPTTPVPLSEDPDPNALQREIDVAQQSAAAVDQSELEARREVVRQDIEERATQARAEADKRIEVIPPTPIPVATDAPWTQPIVTTAREFASGSALAEAKVLTDLIDQYDRQQAQYLTSWKHYLETGEHPVPPHVPDRRPKKDPIPAAWAAWSQGNPDAVPGWWVEKHSKDTYDHDVKEQHREVRDAVRDLYEAQLRSEEGLVQRKPGFDFRRFLYDIVVPKPYQKPVEIVAGAIPGMLREEFGYGGDLGARVRRAARRRDGAS